MFIRCGEHIVYQMIHVLSYACPSAYDTPHDLLWPHIITIHNATAITFALSQCNIVLCSPWLSSFWLLSLRRSHVSHIIVHTSPLGIPNSNTAASFFSLATCVPENGQCSRTVFSPCCDPLYCNLDYPGSGKCVKCLAKYQPCMGNNECCSKDCRWYGLCG